MIHFTVESNADYNIYIEILSSVIDIQIKYRTHSTQWFTEKYLLDKLVNWKIVVINTFKLYESNKIRLDPTGRRVKKCLDNDFTKVNRKKDCTGSRNIQNLFAESKLFVMDNMTK